MTPQPIETALREEAHEILASTTGKVWVQASWDEDDQCWVTFNRLWEDDVQVYPHFEPKWWIPLPAVPA